MSSHPSLSLDGIFILSPYRTGSTVVFQIVKELIGYNPYKVHDTDTKFDIGILCIRDPYYSISSMFRLNRGDMVDLIDHHYQWSSFYINNRNKKNVLVIRYENYINNPIGRIRKIADFLSIKISDDRIHEINNKTSIESNKKIADALNDFDIWDSETYIHGDHIGSPNNQFKYQFSPYEIRKIEGIRKRMRYRRK